jgi:serine/threonine protein kinase
LTHANVVTVFDYFEQAGAPFIAMEYVERGSLRPYVGQMTPAQIGGVLEGLLAGLAAAEQRGVVHRDLKPENLMVTNDGAVKIADFGIAKATQASGTSAFMTATGHTIGTPAYMAPEQAMAKDIGPWTDLYSVGCIAYELLAGVPPFYDSDTPDGDHAAAHQRAASAPHRRGRRRPGHVGLDRAPHGQGVRGSPGVRDRGVGGARGDPDRQPRSALAA